MLQNTIAALAPNVPDTFQIAAWQAAVIGVIIGAIQLLLGLIRQRKVDRQAQAKAGYELVDALFDDAFAIEFLYAIDRIADGKTRHVNSTIESDFWTHFEAPHKTIPPARLALVHSRLDAVIYYLDRFEHAIRSGITQFSDVEMPIGYYIKLLAPLKASLSQYVADVGYTRVLAFLDRFPAWKAASPAGRPA